MQQPPPAPKGKRQLRLEIPNTLSATYANAAVIGQTHSEIILDFIQIIPNDPRARVQSRIVMTPTNAKSFLRALQQNLDRFEERHGEVKLPPKPESLADRLFSTVKPDDEEDEDNAQEDEIDDES